MFLGKSRLIRRMPYARYPFGMIARRKGVWSLRKLRNVPKPELISKVGPFWKRSPGDKNRETWLKERDKNTGFFHRMTNAHRRRNCLKSICINGRKLDKEVDIKEGLVDAFQNPLSRAVGAHLFLI